MADEEDTEQLLAKLLNQAPSAPAFLALVATALRKQSDFFKTPNWQSVLLDTFKTAAATPNSAADTSSTRFSLNSTTTSIPASPIPVIAIAPNRSRPPGKQSATTTTTAAATTDKSATSRDLADLLNIARQTPPPIALSIISANEIIAAKTPEPVLCVSATSSDPKRYSFDIPETQAFVGANDTIPDSQAFAVPAVPPAPKPKPPPDAIAHDSSSVFDEFYDDEDDDAFFQVDAASFECSIGATQSQLMPDSPTKLQPAVAATGEQEIVRAVDGEAAERGDAKTPDLLFDGNDDAELSAICWNEPSVLDGDQPDGGAAAKGDTVAASVTPEMQFGNAHERAGASVTPELSLDAPADSANAALTLDNDEDIFAMPTQAMVPLKRRASMENDVFNRATQALGAHSKSVASADVDNDIFNQATQAFVRLTRCDDDDIFNQATQAVVAPARRRSLRSEKNRDDDDIFNQATQAFADADKDIFAQATQLAIPLRKSTVHADQVEDIFEQATQLAMPTASRSDVGAKSSAESCSGSSGTDVGAKKKNPLKKLTLAKSAKSVVLVTAGHDAAYDADTQVMPAAKQQGPAILDANVDDDDVYNVATQSLLPAASVTCHKTDRSPVFSSPLTKHTDQRAKKTLVSANVAAATSDDVCTPKFDYIRMADPQKILEAERLFIEKCRNEPHKKLLFHDSSDDDEDEVVSAKAPPIVTAKVSTRAARKTTAVAKAKRTATAAPKPPQPQSASAASTSAQNMTTESESRRDDSAQSDSEDSARIATKRRSDGAAEDPLAKRRRNVATATSTAPARSERVRKASRKLAEVEEAKENGRKVRKVVPEEGASKEKRISVLRSHQNKSVEKMDAEISPEKKRGWRRKNNVETPSKAEKTANIGGRQTRRVNEHQPADKQVASTGSADLPKQSPYTIPKKAPSPPQILFTVVEPQKYETLIARLGGRIVSKPADCTVLISNKVFRTFKFLSAMAAGVQIVTEAWLQASDKAGHFVDLAPFALCDREQEKRYKFELAASLEASRKRRILHGYSVFVTAGTKPPTEELKTIIECAGGRCLLEKADLPRKGDTVFAVSDKAKAALWPQLRRDLNRKDLLIVTPEAVMSGVVLQRLSLDSFRL